MPLRPKTIADLGGFVLGLGALWIQVVLIRRLMAAFSGNELTIGVSLAAWLAWTGLGGALTGRAADRSRSPRSALAGVFIAAGLLAPVLALGAARIKPWLGVGPGEIAGLPVIAAAAFIIAAPVCVLLGYAFNLSARLQSDHQTAAGRTYRFEALGAFAAGAGLSLWFAGDADPLWPALAIGFILPLAAAAIAWGDQARGRAAVGAAFGAIGLLGLGLLGLAIAGWDPGRVYQRLYWGEREVLAAQDTRHGYLAATRTGGEVTIFEDGVPAATFPDPEANALIAHLPMLCASNLGAVLVIGGGFTGMAREILKYPIDRLDYVQLDPAWIELERRFAPGFDELATNPKVHLHVADGRAFLRSADRDHAEVGPFDVVIVNLPEPHSASLDRYYTVEFFELVRRTLLPMGVVAFGAGTTPPNKALSPGELGLLACALRTAEAAFTKVELFPLDQNLILAGDQLSRIDPDRRRLEAGLIDHKAVTVYAAKGALESELDPRVLSRLKASASAADVLLDRDLFPQGFSHGLIRWAERASPGAAPALRAIWRLPAWSLLLFPGLVLVAWIGLGRRRGGLGTAAVAAGASGFATMVIEVALLIAYQMVAGSVYFMLAGLTGSFMVGLAGGAWLRERGGERLGLSGSLAGLTVMAAVALLIVTRAFGVGLSAWGVAVYFVVLLLGLGAAAGAVFAAAAGLGARGPGEVGLTAGWINGAEHFGGALGGLVAGAWLVPAFGIVRALGAALLVAAAALVLSVFARPRPGLIRK